MACKWCKFSGRMKAASKKGGKVVILDHILHETGIHRLYLIPLEMDIVRFSELPHKQKSKFWIENLTELPTRCTCPEPEHNERPVEASIFSRRDWLKLFKETRCEQ